MRPLPFTRIPILQQVLQPSRPTRQHSFQVDFHRDDLQPPWSRRLNRIHIGELFAQDTLTVAYPIAVFIPRITQTFERLGEAIRRAVGEDDLRSIQVGDVGVQVLAGELAQEGEKGRVAVCLAILKGSGKVDFGGEVGRWRGVGDEDTGGGRGGGREARCGELRGKTGWMVRRGFETVGKSCGGFEGVVREV